MKTEIKNPKNAMETYRVNCKKNIANKILDKTD